MCSSNYVRGMQMKLSGCLEFPFLVLEYFLLNITVCAIDSAGDVIAKSL